MAKETTYTCDICGEKYDEYAVRFRIYKGWSYGQIDLCPECEEKLEEHFKNERAFAKVRDEIKRV